MEFPLPDELIELAFNYLDVPSILSCMGVCKLFHSIISGSTLLSYKIELFASHMEDNSLSPIDTVTRFNLLREHNKLGVLGRYTCAVGAHQNEIFFDQLPCELKGVTEKRWSVPFDFTMRDFTFDDSQDLIVLVELVGNFPNTSCNVYLRTLSGTHHPRTVMPRITCELGLQTGSFPLMQICSDHFAILFCDQHDILSQKLFIVWNWQTGRRKVYIRLPNFQSFAFMTEDLILAGIMKTYREPTLQVLSIAGCANPIHALEDMPYICELQYPDLMKLTEYFLIRSDPTPSWRPPPDSGAPFYCSRKDFIFAISMRHVSLMTTESTLLFVPLSTLLLEVERSRDGSPRIVSWKNWGPTGTRMIFRQPSETWVCYTYGMKFVNAPEAQRIARVYDFNPHARKLVKSTVDSPVSWKPLRAGSQLTDWREIFEEEVTTTLPGRVANFKLGDSGETGWEAIMVGEDHILMVQSASHRFGYMAM